MKLTSTLAAAALCTAALAQDDPAKKPDPAPAPSGDVAKPDPAPTKERKVDPEAMKALERFLGLMHLPGAAGIKELRAKGSMEEMGETIRIDPKWSVDKGLDYDISIPDAIQQMLEAQGLPEAQHPAIVRQQLGFAGLVSAFDPVGRNWAHFDVSIKQSGDDQVVELSPFDDQADARHRTYLFSKDGLIRKTTIELKPPRNGVLTSELTFEKKGERHLLVSRSLTLPPPQGGQIDTAFTYFDGPNGSYLVKEVLISSGQGDQVISFHDYVVDGKPVESTKAATEKPVEPSKDAAKPVEPAGEKPAEKPAEPPK